MGDHHQSTADEGDHRRTVSAATAVDRSNYHLSNYHPKGDLGTANLLGDFLIFVTIFSAAALDHHQAHWHYHWHHQWPSSVSQLRRPWALHRAF